MHPLRKLRESGHATPAQVSALLAETSGVDEIMLGLLYDIRNNRQTVADARQFFEAY
jgi:hypothetical protein